MILRGSVYSEVLEMDTGLTVVTPKRFDAEGPYKVAYLLHGLTGNNGNWTDYTLLPLYAKKRDTVFILPEAARSFYSDMRYGQRFFSYVSQELPYIVKKLFRISAQRQDTAIIGGSMGGYGALKCALTYPEHYGYCCTMAAACLFLQDYLAMAAQTGGHAEVTPQLRTDFRSIFGEGLDYSAQNDISHLAKSAATAQKKPRFYLECGKGDELLAENRRFAGLLQELGYEAVYKELPGSHDWPYFDRALERAVDFCLPEA